MSGQNQRNGITEAEIDASFKNVKVCGAAGKTESLGRTVYRSVEDLPGSSGAAYIDANRNLIINIVPYLTARDTGGDIC